jgi:hypothetical protein
MTEGLRVAVGGAKAGVPAKPRGGFVGSSNAAVGFAEVGRTTLRSGKTVRYLNRPAVA